MHCIIFHFDMILWLSILIWFNWYKFWLGLKSDKMLLITNQPMLEKNETNSDWFFFFHFFSSCWLVKKSVQIGASLVRTIVQGYCDADWSTWLKLPPQRRSLASKSLDKLRLLEVVKVEYDIIPCFNISKIVDFEINISPSFNQKKKHLPIYVCYLCRR